MAAKPPLDRDTRKLFEAFVAKHKPLDPLTLAFRQQQAFINDPSRMKVLFCTRRAAKSYTAGLYAVDTALKNPSCNIALLGLTISSSMGIFWKDILKDLDKRLNLNARFNIVARTMTLQNGAVIFVTGIDANEDEMSKLLGRKFKLVVLDEGSTYSIDLHAFVALIKPALADQLGTLCMMGTSSNITRGLFFDVTRGIEAGWSMHTWAAYDNPHMADQWAWDVAEIEHDRPAFLQSALFRQHYLNEWAVDDNARVYKYSSSRNYAQSLPKLRADGWQHVLGVDLGSRDDTAFSVLAFHDEDPRLFVRHVEKRPGMDFTDVSKRVTELDAVYKFNHRVVDGANKQGVDEMNRRHGLGLVAADKRDKADFVSLLNDDLAQGTMTLLPGAALLAEEWTSLVWCTDVGGALRFPLKENPNLPNHAADATLYAWRKCYQYLSERPKPKPKVGTPQWGQEEQDRMWEAEMEQAEREREENEDGGW